MVSIQDHVLQQSFALHAGEWVVPLIENCDAIAKTEGVIISGADASIEVWYCESINQFLYSKLQP